MLVALSDMSRPRGHDKHHVRPEAQEEHNGGACPAPKEARPRPTDQGSAEPPSPKLPPRAGVQPGRILSSMLQAP